jgi:hypothetical protein
VTQYATTSVPVPFRIKPENASTSFDSKTRLAMSKPYRKVWLRAQYAWHVSSHQAVGHSHHKPLLGVTFCTLSLLTVTPYRHRTCYNTVRSLFDKWANTRMHRRLTVQYILMLDWRLPRINHIPLRTPRRRVANQEQMTHVIYPLLPHTVLVVLLMVSSIGWLFPAPCNPILGARGPRYSVCTCSR